MRNHSGAGSDYLGTSSDVNAADNTSLSCGVKKYFKGPSGVLAGTTVEHEWARVNIPETKPLSVQDFTNIFANRLLTKLLGERDSV
jgi:hypothetical protein